VFFSGFAPPVLLWHWARSSEGVYVYSRDGDEAVLKSPSEGKKRHHHLETQHVFAVFIAPVELSRF